MDKNNLGLGKFVFFTDSERPNKVIAGRILAMSADKQQLSVHEHRQAAKQQSRFTPLYLNTKNKRFEQKEVPQSFHQPTTSDIDASSIMIVGNIAGYHIDTALLDALKSMGVLHE